MTSDQKSGRFHPISLDAINFLLADVRAAAGPLVVADIMWGTGRFNLAQGAIATVQGIGASLSGLAAGEIGDHFGYNAAFLASAAAAFVALIVFAIGMPETRPAAAETSAGGVC